MTSQTDNQVKPEVRTERSDGSLHGVVSRWNFKPRLTRGGAVKDYPDEWVCATCAWAKASKVTFAAVRPDQKKVWCCAAEEWVWHKSDRPCYEEPLEVKMEREAANAGTQRPGATDAPIATEIAPPGSLE